jgi:glycosyltransferase involved in cell wall biosynthesis
MTEAQARLPRPIRVLHVVSQLSVGGMEKLLLEFAGCADRDSFALRFLSLGAGGALAKELRDAGHPVTALQEPSGLRPGLILRLAGFFRGWGIDVVHTHNTGPLLYAGPAARLARVPVLLHTRHGQRYYASRRETAAFRWTSRLADCVVCVSKDSAELSAQEGVSAAKIRTIWNGIDVRRFSYRGPSPGGPAVMVGRLSPEKDVGNLLEAVAIVVKREPGFRVEIAGNGPCAEQLKQRAVGLGLSAQVRFLGEVQDVPALLAGASMFVLPSLTEGVSLTLLEAMARGLPIVATRVGGNAEVVSDGETGLLVPARSPDQLAAAMLKLRGDPAAAERMARAGRQRVEQHFDARRMVGDYENLYRELCSRALRRTIPRRSRDVGLSEPGGSPDQRSVTCAI